MASLIVCPPTLVAHWPHEIQKFVGSGRVSIVQARDCAARLMHIQDCLRPLTMPAFLLFVLFLSHGCYLCWSSPCGMLRHSRLRQAQIAQAM